MATKTDSRIYIINSYQFETKEEYEQALQEKNGINYLNAQLDVNNIEKVYLYIHNHLHIHLIT